MSIYDKAQRDANKLHATAKNGTLNIDGTKYTLTFDHYAGVYNVTEPDGAELVRFNTRSIRTAQRYLREHLA